MILRLDWTALRCAARNLNVQDLETYVDVTEEMKGDESFLRCLHHILFEIHVMEGFLICPETGRKFPIRDGIPNMLLHEDEV